MRIVANRVDFEDGETRPIILAEVQSREGTTVAEQFLNDTGADRTEFSQALLERLDLPFVDVPAGEQLHGISGAAPFVIVESVIELLRDDGGPARMRGTSAAFTDPLATDLSILGRDVLNHFDIILSRRNNEALFLSQRRSYQVIVS